MGDFTANERGIQVGEQPKVVAGWVIVTSGSKGIIRQSPNGTWWRETIDNEGRITTVATDPPEL